MFTVRSVDEEVILLDVLRRIVRVFGHTVWRVHARKGLFPLGAKQSTGNAQ